MELIFKLSKASKVRSVLRQYSPDFDPLGLDESYLDMTEHMVVSEVLILMMILWRPHLSTLNGHHFRTHSRQSLPLSDRTVILNSCDDCSTPNDEKLRKCTSCGRDIFKEFDLTIEGAVAEMRLKVKQESKLTCSAGIGLGPPISKVNTVNYR